MDSSTFNVKEVKFLWSFRKSEISFPSGSHFSRSVFVGNDNWEIKFASNYENGPYSGYFAAFLFNRSVKKKSLAHIELSLISKNHTTAISFDHVFITLEVMRMVRFAPKNLYIDNNGALLEESVDLTCAVSIDLWISAYHVSVTYGNIITSYT